MANLGTLVTNTIANVAPFQKGMKKMQTSAKGASKAMATLKSAAASLGVVLGIGTLVKAVGYSIRAFQEQELAATQLRTVLRSTGHAAGLTATQLTSMAKSLASLSMFSDEAIIKSQSLLLTFTNIGKKAFPEAQRTILDMATAMGTDLKGATIQLGKALNDPIKGVSALAEVGVSFTQQQKDQIKVLMGTNDTLGAQKIILQELAKEFGGSAAAAANTFAGKVALVQEKFQDLAADLGRDLAPKLLLIMRFLEEAIESARRLGIIGDDFKTEAPGGGFIVDPARATAEDLAKLQQSKSALEFQLSEQQRQLAAWVESTQGWWGALMGIRSDYWTGEIEQALEQIPKDIRATEENIQKANANINAITTRLADPEHAPGIAAADAAAAAKTKADLNAQIAVAREKMAQAQRSELAAQKELDRHKEFYGAAPTGATVRLQQAVDKLSDAVTEQKKALEALQES